MSSGQSPSRQPPQARAPEPPRVPGAARPRFEYRHGTPDPDEEEADPNPEYGYTERTGAPVKPRLAELRLAQEFIDAMKDATHQRSGMSPEAIARMEHPELHSDRSITAVEQCALRMYLARGDASEQNYEDHRFAIQELHPNDNIPSYEQLKGLVSRLTGIEAIIQDMCVKSCIAYTGPFAHLTHCPICPTHEPRYDQALQAKGKLVPRRTFYTFPLGPQLQNQFVNPESARRMHHRRQATADIRAGRTDAKIINDIYHGSDYLEAVEKKIIKDDDLVVLLSIDGAQLYASKQSDCWFLIWVLFDLSPDNRYKKWAVMPGLVIPGPHKPKNMDSFLFTTFYHLAAIQKAGLPIWDSSENRLYRSNVHVVFGTSDGPGLTHLSGGVGHQGRFGCRAYCGMEGRHKPSASTYYPAMLRPDNYNVQGSMHDDISLRVEPEHSSRRAERYEEALKRVKAAPNQAQYERLRRDSGISKPSLFEGLPFKFPIPLCFPLDFMHHLALNITDLVISLLRGTIACDDTDDKLTWLWAVLSNKDRWDEHGALVEALLRYLPGSFERPPRNPAEKISSGYKAWEFQLYVYGLLPGLLRHILGEVYYRHFCHLVAGARLAFQRTLHVDSLVPGHMHLLEYMEGLERIYYQRRVDRLHFVRPCVHSLGHIFTEVYRTGPGICYSQWVTENYIGNITREIKQHVTPYANVGERAYRRVQVNALQAIFPQLDRTPPANPPTSIDCGNGYYLLPAAERTAHYIDSQQEVIAVHTYLRNVKFVVDPGWRPYFRKWARVRLPNGQLVRTAWKEVAWENNNRTPRRARMVKLRGGLFAEIQYFFQFSMNNITEHLAMASRFSDPDRAILQDSCNVLSVHSLLHDTRRVIPIKDIEAVVAMCPLPLTDTEKQLPNAAELEANCFFVVEKPGLEVMELHGDWEDAYADEDDNESD